jgi:transposase
VCGMRTDKRGFFRMDAENLRRAMEQVWDKRIYIRMWGVLLWCEGKRMKEIMALLSRSRQVIHRWVQLFLKTHDPLCLYERERSGRPKAADPITKERILDALQVDPGQAGYRANAWTVKTLADYLNKHYQANITTITLRRRMKQIGLRYKRPRYVYQEKALHVAQKKGRLSES